MATQAPSRSKSKKSGDKKSEKKAAPRTSTPVEGGALLVKEKAKKKKKKKKKKEKGEAGKKKGGGKKKKDKAKKKPKKRVFTAATADRHELYQLAVQSPEEDCAFLRRVYKSYRKKDAEHFREDFCGTALLCATWIKKKGCTAEGFDIDPNPISWGLVHNFEPLGDAAERATIQLKDVREPSATPPDVRSAQNFSYFVFKDRPTLLEYCRRAYEDLADDGIFVMDIYGGPEAMEEMEEVRDIEEGFTYVWDQDAFWPATGDYKTYIHFQFKDGTEIKRAFRYDWRLWGIMEVRDVLLEAGFPVVDSYWEGTDEDGESGNGIYRRSRRGENCLAWVTYLVAVK